MSEVKDYLKVVITAIVVCLSTLLTTSFISFPTNTKKNIEQAEKNANAYTDKQIAEHEAIQKAQQETILEKINSIETSSSNTEKLVMKLIDLELKNRN